MMRTDRLDENGERMLGLVDWRHSMENHPQRPKTQTMRAMMLASIAIDQHFANETNAEYAEGGNIDGKSNRGIPKKSYSTTRNCCSDRLVAD